MNHMSVLQAASQCALNPAPDDRPYSPPIIGTEVEAKSPKELQQHK